jgi:DNA-binding response OmpR family regulator
MFTILLCSQHPNTILWLDHAFRQVNYNCRITTEWDVLFSVVQGSYIDAVLLDAAMEGIEEQCRHLKALSDVPLIVIAGQESEVDALLDAGADDVILEDTSFPELLEITQSKMRRAKAVAAS